MDCSTTYPQRHTHASLPDPLTFAVVGTAYALYWLLSELAAWLEAAADAVLRVVA